MPSKRRTRPPGQARRRQGRGINPLYVLIPVALMLLAAGAWLLVAGGRPLAGRAGPSDTDERPRFPNWLQIKGRKVRRAYTQAVAHREDLRYIPCYCGCGSLGHRAVADCHIADVAADGSITYEQHAST